MEIPPKFASKIEKTATCWLWTGTKNYYGYGVAVLKGDRRVRAHRLSYEIFVGKIPRSKVIMHTCDNPPCVNPKHLRVGTKAENNRDRILKKRGKYNMDRAGCRLTPEQVKSIIADERQQIVIAADYGIHQCHVSRIKSGIRRKYV